MSIYCKVQRESLYVGGDEIKVGELTMVPNSMAYANLKNGRLVAATGEEHMARAEVIEASLTDEQRMERDIAKEQRAKDEKAAKKRARA